MFPHYKYVNLDSDYLDVFSGELLEELKAEGKEGKANQGDSANFERLCRFACRHPISVGVIGFGEKSRTVKRAVVFFTYLAINKKSGESDAGWHLTPHSSKRSQGIACVI